MKFTRYDWVNQEKFKNKWSMLRLLPLIVQCGFHASLYSLNILLGYIENLKALKLDQKTLTIPMNQKTV